MIKKQGLLPLDVDFAEGKSSSKNNEKPSSKIDLKNVNYQVQTARLQSY
jgi:hypothetical protein